MADEIGDVTSCLHRWRGGDAGAASDLLALVYRDLRRIAANQLRRERRDHTLQATALVNEAWLRLSGATSNPVATRLQFFRAMAAYMRNQLVDHGRRRNAAKRGGGRQEVSIDEAELQLSAPAAQQTTDEEDLSRLDAALMKLSAGHGRAAKVLELRFFGGKTIEEIAEEMQLSTGTVKRDLTFARAFLAAEIRP